MVKLLIVIQCYINWVQLTIMKPSQYKLKPQQQIPKLTLLQLSQYPDLQRRVNSQQFELSGIHNLIVQLRKQTMQQLKQQFINNNNNVNLHQFMWLISNSLISKNNKYYNKTVQEEYYQYQLQYEIVKVFEEIDIDNSNSISWQEYIQYITSSSLMEISHNSQQQLAALKLQEKKIKQLQFSHRQKASFRKNQIRKIVEIQRLSLIAIIQKKSDLLTFINVNGGPTTRPFQLNGIDSTRVLSLDYSDDDRMFGVLMSSHHVVFVQDGQMQKVHEDNKFSGDQVQIMYLRKHRLWLLISLSNTIQIFSPAKGRSKQNQPKQTLMIFKPHAQELVAVRQLQNPLSLVTASRNGSLKIWSLSLNQLLVQLTPCKQDDFQSCKSIKGLQVYNNQSISFMICWMFSPQISVWLPSSSLTKPYLGKLKGHIGIVQQAKFLTNFPIVVSIDHKNSIRVWDVTKMQCVQTWKMEVTFSVKIDVLKSVPFVLFYEKLIQFYKSTKEADFILYNTQKKSIDINTDNNKSGTIKSNILLSKNEKDNVNQKNDKKVKKVKISQKQKSLQQQALVVQKQTHNPKQKLNQQTQSTFPNKTNDNPLTIPILILYDTYLDCLIILTQDKVSLVGINTGKLLHRAFAQSKGETFITMCLKQNRRLFVANNFGQIDCLKVEDCSKIYKLYPFKSLIDHIKESKDKQKQIKFSDHQIISKSKKSFASEKIHHQKSNSETNLKKKNNIIYETFKLDYNIYNKVLIIIAQSQYDSLLVTYDNFSSLEPSKKKEVIFDQKNLCSFASSQKCNLFYIGSNRPQLITVWDYHNFIILRTIQMPNSIRSLSVQSLKYNLLFVTSSFDIFILRVLPIDAKNNNRSTQNNLISCQFNLKSRKPLNNAEVILINVQTQKKKAKKNKVKFDDQQEQQNEIKKQFQNIPQNNQRLQLYILNLNTISIAKLQSLFQDLPQFSQPTHNQKSNITKQLKNISLTIHQCPQPENALDLSEIVKQNISSSKKNACALGIVNGLIYFCNQLGVLHFYKVSQGKVWSKLSMPKCEIIQWQIFYNLVAKVLARLVKAQSVSKQIYAYKRNEKVDENKIQRLRISFILNKYFALQDMQALRNYFAGIDKIKKPNKINNINKQQQLNDMILKMEQNSKQLQNKQIKKGGNESTLIGFQQKIQERNRTRSLANQKMKQIEKKYNKVFTYLKNKPQKNEDQQGGTAYKNFLNTGPISTKKLAISTEKKRQSSVTNFKIRNTASSINKMYYEHSKQIKNYLSKIGIINSKMKELKL